MRRICLRREIVVLKSQHHECAIEKLSALDTKARIDICIRDEIYVFVLVKI